MLVSFAIIFLLGLLFGKLSNMLKLPEIIGFIIAGMFMGPYGFDLLSDSLLEIGPVLRQVSLVIILTRAGLSLKIGDLQSIGRPALLLCVLPALCEMGVIVLVAPLLFGVTYGEGLLLGCVIAAVSPAIIVPRMLFLKEKGYGSGKKIADMITMAASLDDIFVIVAFAGAIEWVKSGTFHLKLLWSIPSSIVLGGVVGVTLGLGMSYYFQKFETTLIHKVIILLSSFFLLLYGEELLSNSVSFSALLAIMCCGLTLNYKSASVAKDLVVSFAQLWYPAQIWLFVLVGTGLNMSLAMTLGVVGIMIILLGLIGRIMGVGFSLWKTPLNPGEKIFVGLSFLPKATVQAAIGSIPLSLGLSCGELVQTLSVMAILITAPLGACLIDYFYPKLLKQEEI